MKDVRKYKKEDIERYKEEIARYERKIKNTIEFIEENKDNPEFYKPTMKIDMHDNGKSRYENEKGMIDYYEITIERLKKQIEENKQFIERYNNYLKRKHKH